MAAYNQTCYDCIFMDTSKGVGSEFCRALRAVYCKAGNCNFYKSVVEYNRDGTKKENQNEKNNTDINKY